jgi:endonuclease/exonuclease/phosphatase family metal-dependent hydrolase
MLNLLCYNVEYGTYLDEIITWLSGLPKQPDIICLQEYPQARVKKSNPFHMLGYDCKFAPSFIKQGKTYGELTAYNSKHLLLARSEIVNLGDSKWENLITKNTGQRSALITHFVHRRKKIVIANLHLTWFGLHRKRKNQLKMVIDMVKNYKTTMMVGDYNYSSLILGGGLSHFMADHNFSPTNHTFSTHRLFGLDHQVDYAFHRNCQMIGVKVEPIHYSDHRPMLIVSPPKQKPDWQTVHLVPHRL